MNDDKSNLKKENTPEEKSSAVPEEKIETESFKKYIEIESYKETVETHETFQKSVKKRKKTNKTLIVIIVALCVALGSTLFLLTAKDKPWFRELVGKGVPFFSTQNNTSNQNYENPNIVKVTFPEGFTVLQIAQRLEENGVCRKDDFLKVCNEPYEGIETSDSEERVFLLEGYVFPDTYEFYKNSDPKAVLEKFISNYNSKITPEMEEKAASLGMTIDEVLTLASIIQKECDCDIAECANVSSVFHNRLNSLSFPKLESDVTTFYIKYVLADYLGYKKDTDGNPLPLTQQSDEIRHYIDIYSTYYCKGLPVGPICNPGIKAINAALNPSDTNYYYFLTDSTGVDFYYAETIAQHRENGKKAGLF